MPKSQLVPDHSGHVSAVRHELNVMLDKLVVAHRQFMDADLAHVWAAYETRWELLNELEEFLGDACVELAP